MNTFRAPLIAAAVLTITSCAAFAEVRVIGPDSEHVYSSDPREAGRLLDDEALQRENERKQKAKMEKEYQRDQARRREELDAERARAERDQAAATAYGEQPSDQVWSYAGPFGSRQFRRAFGSGRQIRAGAAPRGAPAVSSSHHR